MAASPSARTSAPAHPAENRLLTIMFAATLAAFIATFNETFLNVGFTHIMADFKIGVPTVQWFATAYMLGADRGPTPQTRHVHGTHGSDDHPRSSWSPSHFWARSTAFPPSSAPSSHSGPHRCGARLDRNTSNHRPPDHKQCRAARSRGFHLGSCRHLVAQLMKQDIYFLAPSDTIRQALHMFVDKRITGVPLLEDDRTLAGFVPDGDVLNVNDDRRSHGRLSVLIGEVS